MATQTEQRALVTAWIDPRDRARLAELAREHDRSLSAEIRRAIATHVEQEPTESGDGA
jgi:predicted transcriptional regulator